MKELIDLVVSCPTNLSCCDFHHAKADQHRHDEACKPMDRYYAAIDQARRRIAIDQARRRIEGKKDLDAMKDLPGTSEDALQFSGRSHTSDGLEI